METELVLDLEDGEIEDIVGEDDESEEVYTPLERPSQPLPPRNVQPVTHSDSASEASSDSDSDSDCNSQRRPRRRPRKIRTELNLPSGPPRKKVNSIWCTEAAEDNLSSNLLNCKVNRKSDFSRDVESYDPCVMMPSIQGSASYKRNVHGSQVSSRPKLMSAKNSRQLLDLSGKELLALGKSVDDPPDALADDIAMKLTEEKKIIIENVIRVAGKQKAIDLYEETVHIERNGGLVVMNGLRKRTSGGVYFHLIKNSQDLTPDQIREIFMDDRRQTARDIKKSKAAQRKEAIRKEDYPTLLSRAEAAIFKKKQIEVETEDAEEVKNPPPSPATDGRDNSNSSCDIDQP